MKQISRHFRYPPFFIGIAISLVACHYMSPEQNQALNVLNVDLAELDHRSDQGSPSLVKFKISLSSPEDGYENIYFRVSIDCDTTTLTPKVDISQAALEVTETIDLVANKTCSLLLKSYSDGHSTFTPLTQPLLIQISAEGIFKERGPVAYVSDGPEKQVVWLNPNPFGPFNLLLHPTTHAFHNGGHKKPPASSPRRGLQMASTSITMAEVPAPLIKSLVLYSEEAVNNAPLHYTLVAQVLGATDCKFMDNTDNTYSPTSWDSLNSAFHSPLAQTCPAFDPGEPGFTPGNWTQMWTSGKKTLIIWINLVNGLSSYTSANFGSQ